MDGWTDPNAEQPPPRQTVVVGAEHAIPPPKIKKLKPRKPKLKPTGPKVIPSDSDATQVKMPLPGGDGKQVGVLALLENPPLPRALLVLGWIGAVLVPKIPVCLSFSFLLLCSPQP